MSVPNRISQGGDLRLVNTIQVVQAFDGDEGVANRLAELKHDFDGIEGAQAIFLSGIFNSL